MMMRLVVSLVTAVLLWNAPAQAAYAFVQGKYGQAFSGTTVSATFTSPVTAGNIILVCAFEASATLGTFSFSDTKNTYTNGTNTVTHLTNQMFSAYAPNVLSGSTTVTLTLSSAISIQGQIWIEEWSGVATTSPADGAGSGLYTAGSNMAGDAFNTGAFTPSTNGDLIWACGRVPAGGGANAGSGFTAAFTDATDSYLSEFQTQGAAGSITPGFTAITGGFDYYALGAAFKAAGGASSPTRSLIGAGK